MLQGTYADQGTGVEHDQSAHVFPHQDVNYARVAGISLIAGAIVATLFNVLFPRGDDPTDSAAMLTMMVENQTLRQVSFLGVTSGLWLLTAGLAGVYWILSRGTGRVLARVGFYGLVVGAVLFTVSTGIGMAATGAAVDWAAGGSDIASVEFAAATALNIADDGVWAMSIIVYWTAIGLLGLSMVYGGTFPRWLAAPAVLLGFANAILIGVPIAFDGVTEIRLIVFAVLAQLTIVWAVATAVWMLRRLK